MYIFDYLPPVTAFSRVQFVFLFPVVSFLVSLRFCSLFLLSLQEKSWMIMLINFFFITLVKQNKASYNRMNLYECQVCLESCVFLFQVIRKKNLIKPVNISVVHHATLFWKRKLNWVLYLVGNNSIFPNKIVCLEKIKVDNAELAWGSLSRTCLSTIINIINSQECLLKAQYDYNPLMTEYKSYTFILWEA